MQRPVCLTIGGSDSSSGAGIQADLLSFQRLGIKGCSAITALTAQNPRRVSRIEPVPVAQLQAEIEAVFDYYQVAAVKTGMLVDAAHVQCVARLLGERHAGPMLVVDPVMVASSGAELLDDAGVRALAEKLFPLATLITPNLPEAERLLGGGSGDPVEDAASLAMRFHTSVLLKGGHGDGEVVSDLLVTRDGDVEPFTHARQRWDEEQAHGTGCRLASAIAAYLARGMPLVEAVRSASEGMGSIDQ